MEKLLIIKKCPEMITRTAFHFLIITGDHDNILIIKKCPEMIIRIT